MKRLTTLALLAGMLVALFFYGFHSLPLPGGCFSRPGLGPAADLLSYRATGVPAPSMSG